MIQVSIGRRSRSPLSPLSLRMMSRADFRSAPSDWAVVGWLMGFGIKLCGIDCSVQAGHIVLKLDWKFPVGVGLLGFPEALRISRESLSDPILPPCPPDCDGISV